jgi:hypothetical protein
MNNGWLTDIITRLLLDDEFAIDCGLMITKYVDESIYDYDAIANELIKTKFNGLDRDALINNFIKIMYSDTDTLKCKSSIIYTISSLFITYIIHIYELPKRLYNTYSIIPKSIFKYPIIYSERKSHLGIFVRTILYLYSDDSNEYLPECALTQIYSDAKNKLIMTNKYIRKI